MTTANAVTNPNEDFKQWRRIKNTHSTTLPAFGCFKVSGITTVAGVEVLQVTRPTSDVDAMTSLCGFCGPSRVLAGKLGWGTFQLPARAAYDNANTPANREIWGPQTDKWTIKKHNPGFITIGTGSSENERVLVVPMPRGSFIAEATSAITARSGSTPGSGTVKLQYNNGGTIADLVTGLTAKSWVTTALSSGDKLKCSFDPLGQLWVDNKDCT